MMPCKILIKINGHIEYDLKSIEEERFQKGRDYISHTQGFGSQTPDNNEDAILALDSQIAYS